MKTKTFFKNKNKKILYGVLILILTILVIGGINLGKCLVDEDSLEKADVLVVLMGSVSDRIFHAVDLYEKGLSEKIIFVRSYRPCKAEQVKRNVQIPGDAQISKNVAVSLGIPAKDIVILEAEAKSTQDEALAVKTFLEKTPSVNTMILVTSKYHSYRAKKIFKKALKPLQREVKILSSPSQYDTYNAKKWWIDREDLKHTAMECLKLMNFYLREQFQL